MTERVHVKVDPKRDTVVKPQGEIEGDPRFTGHTVALKDLQEFVQSRQIPYLGQWYSRVALQYLGIEITINERVADWSDEGRYLIREVHTHGDHITGFETQDDQGFDISQTSEAKTERWAPPGGAAPAAPAAGAAPLRPGL
mmetsp:Transcript_29931/g.65272  ORF Transcript_29931/g.65272 Transcript_29931/m.65272 type:complete len:141 (+) Transcript_29931:94-516(+)